MPQQDQQPGRTGIYLSPMAQRRAAFAAACGALFAQLRLADSVDGAAGLLDGSQPDLLVIDLERFEPSIDLAGAGRPGGAPRRRADPAAVPLRTAPLAAGC
jgi:hypothetical protein